VPCFQGFFFAIWLLFFSWNSGFSRGDGVLVQGLSGLLTDCLFERRSDARCWRALQCVAASRHCVSFNSTTEFPNVWVALFIVFCVSSSSGNCRLAYASEAMLLYILPSNNDKRNSLVSTQWLLLPVLPLRTCVLPRAPSLELLCESGLLEEINGASRAPAGRSWQPGTTTARLESTH
jgi:hypothetical protein